MRGCSGQQACTQGAPSSTTQQWWSVPLHPQAGPVPADIADPKDQSRHSSSRSEVHGDQA